MFRSLLPTVARWRSLEGEGLEHLSIAPAGNTFNATGVIIGERGDVPYGVRYSIDCASDWRVFHFLIETTSGKARTQIRWKWALDHDGRRRITRVRWLHGH